MMQLFARLMFSVLALSTSLVGQQGKLTTEQVVRQGAPSDMDIQPQVAGPDSCSAVLSASQDGTPLLVAAAYTNGAFGHLRMLRVDPQTLQVKILADVSRPQYLLAGAGCRLSCVDLRGSSGNPGLAQVLQLDFPGLSGQGSATWFFQWDGNKFTNLGPLRTAHKLPPETMLNGAFVLDLDHTGPPQIVSIGDGELHPDASGVWDLPVQLVWKFDGTSFVQEKSLVALATFTRSQGKPGPVLNTLTADSCFQPSCYEFDLKGPASTYVLKIVNGDGDGNHRASSGHVLLNNVEVASPSDFNEKVEFITKPVTLLQRNTVYATLEGKPGATIIVTIEPGSAP